MTFNLIAHENKLRQQRTELQRQQAEKQQRIYMAAQELHQAIIVYAGSRQVKNRADVQDDKVTITFDDGVMNIYVRTEDSFSIAFSETADEGMDVDEGSSLDKEEMMTTLVDQVLKRQPK